jgi:galactokinase
MTGSGLASALVERGLDPGEFPAKRSLFDLVLSRFAQLHAQHVSDADTHAWWVPGRLEVFGTHTDYAGGRTLVCAVPRGFAVVARARADGTVRVVDVRREQEVTLTGEERHVRAISVPQTGWRNYANVVARRLARNFPGAALGADIVIASDLPRASGMSSSSALVVAIASALVRVAGLENRPDWRNSMVSPQDVAGYYACMENGLSFGSLTGDAGVGTHGGSEDHAAIVTGRPGHLAAFAFVPMRALDVVRVPERWRFVLTPCGVAAQKTGTARDAYNRLASGTQVLLNLWNRESKVTARSLGAALLTSGEGSSGSGTSPAASDRLRAIVRRSNVAGWPRDALERRMDHFIREDARIPAAVSAFRDGAAAELGQLAERSQVDAETLLGNQIEETRALPRTGRALGAFAARSFGAGFGGSIWALVEHDRAESFARSWHADAFIASPGPPVVELTSTPQDHRRDPTARTDG